MKKLAMAFATVVFLGCNKPPVEAPEVDVCEAACDNLRTLKCPWAAPTPNGATCEQRCHAREKVHYDTGHPQCVKDAKSCEEADKVSAEGC